MTLDLMTLSPMLETERARERYEALRASLGREPTEDEYPPRAPSDYREASRRLIER